MAESSSTTTSSTSRLRLALPRLGIGAAPLGNLYTSLSDSDAQLTLEAAFSQGFEYVDTAPHYGFGLSERRLGKALQNATVPIKISSKVGRVLIPTDSVEKMRHGFVDAPQFSPQFDYTYDGVMSSFASSQARLGRDKIDLLLVHDLGELTHGNLHQKHLKDFLEGGYRAMCELQTSGLVSALGLGVNEWQIAKTLLHEIDLDFILLAGRYSLLEQQAASDFFSLCANKNVNTILGGVFNSGILATGTTDHSKDKSHQKIAYYNYAPAPQSVVERVQKIEKICFEYSVSLAAAAAQFVLAHPQVNSVIFGVASAGQVHELKSWLAEKIPADFWQQLQKHQLIDSDIPLPRDTRLAQKM